MEQAENNRDVETNKCMQMFIFSHISYNNNNTINILSHKFKHSFQKPLQKSTPLAEQVRVGKMRTQNKNHRMDRKIQGITQASLLQNPQAHTNDISWAKYPGA